MIKRGLKVEGGVDATLLSVTGATTLNDTLTVGTSSSKKSTTLNGTLSVTGATTLNDKLSVTGATTLNDTLTVGTSSSKKSTTLNGTLSVTGATTLNSAYIRQSIPESIYESKYIDSLILIPTGAVI